MRIMNAEGTAQDGWADEAVVELVEVTVVGGVMRIDEPLVVLEGGEVMVVSEGEDDMVVLEERPGSYMQR